MSTPKQPSPDALFSLVAYHGNMEAHEIIQSNPHLVSILPGKTNPAYPDGLQRGITIRFGMSRRPNGNVLASIRRDKTMVEIVTPTPTKEDPRWNQVSRVQVSFEIDPITQVVMIHDQSPKGTTATFGKKAQSFELTRLPRRVAATSHVNTKLQFPPNVKFKLIWHVNSLTIQNKVLPNMCDPCFAPTITEPTQPTSPLSPIHPRTSGLPGIRFAYARTLGSGSSASVSLVLNIDTAQHMAAKAIPWTSKNKTGDAFISLKREVETLARLSHANIIRLFEVQGLDPSQTAVDQFNRPSVILLMELASGTVRSLMETDVFKTNVLNYLLYDCLQALDYLDSNGVIHRDLKPENILWKMVGEKYVFLLADFGVSNSADRACSVSGTSGYMAPEIRERGKQSGKSDVWSLLVTSLEAFDAENFRDTIRNSSHEVIAKVQAICEMEAFKPLQPMSRIDPLERASAGDMIDLLFQGVGRATRVSETEEPDNQEATVATPSSSPPASTLDDD